jgi:drug/metabolite transporter (DMT)-like permease
MNDEALLATLLVLVAAVMHAAWNALVKGGNDKTVGLAAVLFVGALVGAVVVVIRPLPSDDAWPWLFGSALTHGAYYTCLLGAYRTSDLGHAYPIARGSAPVLVALASVVVLDVPLAPLELFGAALVSGGIASLALAAGSKAKREAVLWALATGVTIAIYTVLDGTGARRSGDPVSYAGWSFVVQLPGIFVLALVAGRARVMTYLASSWRGVFLGGVMSAGAWIIVLWAMTVIPIAHVAALRETSVIFAVALGARMLREPFGAKRMVAAVFVVAGLFLLHVVA